MNELPYGAYQRVLIPDLEAADEPENKNYKTPRAPIIEERSAKEVPMKYNFGIYKFDIPIFSEMIKRAVRWANGAMKRKKDCIAEEEEVVQKTSCVNPKFMKKHKITVYTIP